MSEPVTLVLGLGREVGEAIARRFRDEHHQVYACDPNEARIEKAREALPDDIILAHCDLGGRLGLRNALTGADEAFGRIDQIVVTPSVPAPDTLADFDDEDFDKVAWRSVRSTVLAIRLASERMRDQDELPASSIDRSRQKGAITVILSSSAMSSAPGRFTESVAQGAILSAVKAAALELAPDRIRVNAIVAVRPRAETTEPWLKSRTPLGRAALADEIADAAIYLSSPSAAIITGTALVLDGGRAALGGIIA